MLLVALPAMGVLGATPACPIASADGYAYTLIGTDLFGAVSGINADGVVAAEGQVSLSDGRRAARWVAGGLNYLTGDADGAFDTAANAINGAGTVVGKAIFDASTLASHAYLALDTTMIDLGTLGGPLSEALGINDAGQVVGFADTPDGRHAFLYESETGIMQDITPFAAAGSIAYGINSSGTVVGSADNRAFARTPEGAIDLGPGEARAISESGIVVGASEGNAYIFGDTPIDLGPGIAYAVNSAGQVVGSIAGRGYLWDANGSTVDLNDGIPDQTWYVIEGRGITEDGRIVARGTRLVNGRRVSCGFLLTPR